jgi:hypothetical protein
MIGDAGRKAYRAIVSACNVPIEVTMQRRAAEEIWYPPLADLQPSQT